MDDRTLQASGKALTWAWSPPVNTLTFVIDVLSPPLGLVYSDPSLNTAYDVNSTDGHNHVYSVAYTATSPIFPGVPAGTYVGFEVTARF